MSGLATYIFKGIIIPFTPDFSWICHTDIRSSEHRNLVSFKNKPLNLFTCHGMKMKQSSLIIWWWCSLVIPLSSTDENWNHFNYGRKPVENKKRHGNIMWLVRKSIIKKEQVSVTTKNFGNQTTTLKPPSPEWKVIANLGLVVSNRDLTEWDQINRQSQWSEEKFAKLCIKQLICRKMQ